MGREGFQSEAKAKARPKIAMTDHGWAQMREGIAGQLQVHPQMDPVAMVPIKAPSCVHCT